MLTRQIALLVFLFGFPLQAQIGGGSIVGVAKDPSGAPVKAAAVIARDTDHGTIYSAQTNDDGAFNLKLQFRKSHVSDEELAAALRAVLRRIESGAISSSAA